MIAGSAERETAVAPVLVVGLGNVLLGDDGVGPELVSQLADEYGDQTGMVEFLDGGTLGIALLGRLSGRQALVILDALNTGLPPGTVTVLAGKNVLEMQTECRCTAHESNALELLAVAALLGDLPDKFYVVGVQPESVATRVGFSEAVNRSLGEALREARTIVNRIVAEVVAISN